MDPIARMRPPGCVGCAINLCCRPCPGCATVFHCVLLCSTRLCSNCDVSINVSIPHAGGGWLVKEARGRIPARSGGPLPMLTMPGDQTKNQVVLLVEHPTKPYQDRCPPCETDWRIWLGRSALTRCYHMTDLAGPPFSYTITNHYQPRS